MFASSPERVLAHVLATLPEDLHRRGKPNRWIEIERRGADTPSFLEGPVVMPDGSLLVCDVAWGRVFRVAAGQFETVCEYEGEPNGLAVDADGSIWIADRRNGLAVLKQGASQPTVVVRGPSLEGFKGLNDLAISEDHSLYFTDQGDTGLHDPTGSLYRWQQNGLLQQVLAGIPSPNGLALAEELDVVYVAATRDNSVWRVPIDKWGQVRKVGRFVQLSGGIGPDGLARSSDGLLAVAHVGFGAVWVFDATGDLVARVDSPTGLLTTNVAFADDSRTLFITESESGSVLAAELKI